MYSLCKFLIELTIVNMVNHSSGKIFLLQVAWFTAPRYVVCQAVICMSFLNSQETYSTAYPARYLSRLLVLRVMLSVAENRFNMKKTKAATALRPY